MAQASIQVTPGSGPAVDFRTVGATPYYRQVLALGDPTTDTGVAPVSAANGLTVSHPAAQVAIPLWGHGSTNSGAPTSATLVGANARSTLPTISSDGNMRPPTADLFGRLVTVPLAPRELVADATISLVATTTETTLIAATANEYHDLTTIVICNANATTDITLTIRSTTGGSARFTLYVPAKATVGFNLPTPAPQAAVNQNWTAQCSAGISGGALIYAQYLRNHN